VLDKIQQSGELTGGRSRTGRKGGHEMFKNIGFFSVGVCLILSIATPVMTQAKMVQEVNDAELEKAARAYREISVINQEFQRSVQQTSNHIERKKLQQQANEQMVKAVEEAGLDVEMYNEIMGKVYKNEKLAEKFGSKIEDVSKVN
jgi:type III secretory pathway component EscR